MRIPRIFTNQTLSIDSQLILEEKPSLHLSKVLRLKELHPIIVFNGKGGHYLAQMTHIEKKRVTVYLSEFHADQSVANLTTHLAVAVSKGDKMDLIIQKCTELGATSITPMITTRSDVKLNHERWQKKLSHWQQVAISACEQSGRNTLPNIEPIIAFNEWTTKTDTQTKLLFHPQNGQASADWKTSGSLSMCFGSEGGFTDEEVLVAKHHGFIIASLGRNVLRAETAPIAALSIAQSQRGYM